MPDPFFTVVLPTYNRARMAAAALLSLLGQSERDWEAFVVDDGSTDDTRRILKAFPQDPRITLVQMDKNRGQHHCRNHAIGKARGRFVTFLDSDDLYLSERLRVFREHAEKTPERGFWFSNAYVRRFDRIIGRLFDPRRDIPEGKVPGHYAMGAEYLPYLTTNVAIKREAFDRFGFYREDRKILEDTELYAGMLAGGLEVGVIRDCLAVRRLHDEQITLDYEKDFEEAALALAAGNPDPGTAKRRRRDLALEVAEYLLKSLEPKKARELLDRELGPAAKDFPVYRRTFLPVTALRLMKGLRRRYLSVRYSEAFAPSEFTRVERSIRPLLQHAERI